MDYQNLSKRATADAIIAICAEIRAADDDYIYWKLEDMQLRALLITLRAIKQSIDRGIYA